MKSDRQKLMKREEAVVHGNKRKTNYNNLRPSKRKKARAWDAKDLEKLYDAFYVFKEDCDMIYRLVFSKKRARPKYMNPEQDFSQRSFR